MSASTSSEKAKAVRNTVFTVAVLALTAVGVQWNEQVAGHRRPVAVNQAVLAQAVNVRDDFPLKLELSRDVVRLGQVQVVSVETSPFADLEIIATGPDGSSDRAETFATTADETGRFSFRFKLDDFRDLGSFTLTVKARLGNGTSYEQKSFMVETWQPDSAKNEEYTHQLLP
jgi:hypothetical protein